MEVTEGLDDVLNQIGKGYVNQSVASGSSVRHRMERMEKITTFWETEFG